ncbi:MAG TPA: ATP-binding protein [Noviherbaspirillum sp.]|nr:ATP-binding protein [Noviherbaspirillum sp.]
MQWFDVDKEGLAQLLARKGIEFVLYELLQNAWDENTTEVKVSLEKVPSTRSARLTVEDDNPTGFADLSHAFTLFADSAKKANPDKRGRFNLGEKLVLALCNEATIESTTGSIVFDADGRRQSRRRRDRGSRFSGLVRMSQADITRCHEAVRRLLPPQGIATYYNGELLPERKPLRTIWAALPTEIADDQGVLRRTVRKVDIEIHEPAPGEVGMLYEMGIPVVETGDRWHINVQQKVPVNFERDNVSPAYLARVRALVVEEMHASLTVEDANSTWVRHAVQEHGHEMESDTVRRIVELRFGEKRVSYDPSDPEANCLAVANGYTVVHGSQMSATEWDAARRAGAILPAGQVTPSPKPYADGGKPLNLVSSANWTPEMRAVVAYIHRLAPKLLSTAIAVDIANEPQWPFSATYGGERLVINMGRLGKQWFAGPLPAINQLLIHEFGHHFSSNHLSADYHKALCRLGADLANLALSEPGLFDRQAH